MTAVASCLQHPPLSLLPGILIGPGYTWSLLGGKKRVFLFTFLDFSDSRLLSGHGEEKNNDNDNNNVVTHLYNPSRERNPAVGPAALIGFEKWYVVIQ